MMKRLKRLVLRGPAFALVTLLNAAVVCGVSWLVLPTPALGAIIVCMGVLWPLGLVIASFARGSATKSRTAYSDVYLESFHGASLMALLLGFAPLSLPATLVAWLARQPERYDLKALGLEDEKVSPVPGDLSEVRGGGLEVAEGGAPVMPEPLEIQILRGV